MLWIHIILLLAGGALACSALIVAKKPDAARLLDQLVPFQAIIGVVLAAVSVINLIKFGPMAVRLISSRQVESMTLLGACIGGILLGVVQGAPMISKITGNGDQVAAKLAPYSVILGIVCAAAGGLLLVNQLGLLKYL